MAGASGGKGISSGSVAEREDVGVALDGDDSFALGALDQLARIDVDHYVYEPLVVRDESDFVVLGIVVERSGASV